MDYDKPFTVSGYYKTASVQFNIILFLTTACATYYIIIIYHVMLRGFVSFIPFKNVIIEITRLLKYTPVDNNVGIEV